MNLADLLLARADTAPAAVALRWRDELTTYGELAERVARVAGGLRALGVGVGDRVGIACANNPSFVLSYLGALWAGAVAVPLNPAGTAEELHRELAGTGATAVVVGLTARAALEAARAAGGLEAMTVVAVGAGDPGEAAAAAGDAVPWDEVAGAEPLAGVERSDEDLAVLIHTSGTSGPPRAAMLTHASLAANIQQAHRHPGMSVREDDVVLAVLPFFHVFGLNAVLGLGLAAGATLVLVERFDAHDTLELVKALGVTVVAGVPPMYAAWLGVADARPDALSSVRLAVSGAAPLSPEIQEAVLARFGLALHQGYGLTEASPIVTCTLGDGHPRPGSIGVSLPGVEVRLVDALGDDVLVGDPGEIWVRGPNVFAGYWDDPEASARVLTPEGWLRTGDVAVADSDGHIAIVDRSKDLIIVSGFNVYPAEVEEVLTRHPSVAEAAVVGIPHPHTVEAVKAFVVAAPGVTVDPDELAAFCAGFLARYKCPSAIEVVDELPRGLAGKLLRRELA